MLVSNLSQLKSAVTNKVDKLLGVFAKSHLSYEYRRPKDQPSLMNLTEAALELLMTKSDQGFFLMVEGAKIDHAHHATYANLALEETLVFDQTIEKTMQMLKEKNLLDDTLVIVTADHSHTMTLPGSPARGASIKGNM